MKKYLLSWLAVGSVFTLAAIDKFTLPNGSFEQLNSQQDWPAAWSKTASSPGKLLSSQAADGKYFLRFEAGYGVIGHTAKVNAPANAVIEVSATVRGGEDCQFGIIARSFFPPLLLKQQKRFSPLRRLNPLKSSFLYRSFLFPINKKRRRFPFLQDAFCRCLMQ